MAGCRLLHPATPFESLLTKSPGNRLIHNDAFNRSTVLDPLFSLDDSTAVTENAGVLIMT
jgi:hypothetical protein